MSQLTSQFAHDWAQQPAYPAPAKEELPHAARHAAVKLCHCFLEVISGLRPASQFNFLLDFSQWRTLTIWQIQDRYPDPQLTRIRCVKNADKVNLTAHYWLNETDSLILFGKLSPVANSWLWTELSYVHLPGDPSQ